MIILCNPAVTKIFLEDLRAEEIQEIYLVKHKAIGFRLCHAGIFSRLVIKLVRRTRMTEDKVITKADFEDLARQHQRSLKSFLYRFITLSTKPKT